MQIGTKTLENNSALFCKVEKCTYLTNYFHIQAFTLWRNSRISVPKDMINKRL